MGFGRGGGFGRGRGQGPGGFGFGRGGAYPYAAPSYGMPYAYPNAPIMTQGQEADMLKAQAEGLSSALEDINKRISDLESQARKQ